MTIPANQLVNVVPSVQVAGGNPLSLNAVVLSTSIRVPIGVTMSFATAAAVGAFFGLSSTEAAVASVYFAGYTNGTKLPSVLYFSQYNTSAQNAYLRSGTFSGVTLAQLQLLSGVLVNVINGVTTTSATINLAAASSFTNAAALIQAGLLAGSPSSSASCTFDTVLQCFVIGSATSGPASTIAFATGSLSAGLKFTSATGAVLSQGAAIATPETVLTQVVINTQNWACFMTTFEPILADKLLFANWVTVQNDRYEYVCWDSDVTALAANATGSFGVLTGALDGVYPIWSTSPLKAAFKCGTTASIDFNRTNGRITHAYKAQAGLTPDITDATQALNLLANGYNFYGAYATNNQLFQFTQNGQISGSWLWADEFENQIYLNSQLQLSLMLLLSTVASIPYNQQGYDLIRAACMGPINDAINFGSIRAGVTLTPSQIAAVNAAAGVEIADTLQQAGWYLDIDDANGTVRTVRASPPITLFYVSGGSIQQIQLASIDIL